MIHVVLASRLPVVRDGMKSVLAPLQDINVVSEVSSLKELDDWKEFPSPDLVIVADSPVDDGRDFLCRFIQADHQRRIIMVAHAATVPQVLGMLRLGVRGLLSGSCAVEHLVAAIRMVSGGRIYLHESLSHLMARNLDGLSRDHTHGALTEREMQILMKLAIGLRVTEIAGQLGISVKTVSTHKGRMMEKMGLTSFSQLVQYALANGLFDAVP